MGEGCRSTQQLGCHAPVRTSLRAKKKLRISKISFFRPCVICKSMFCGLYFLALTITFQGYHEIYLQIRDVFSACYSRRPRLLSYSLAKAMVFNMVRAALGLDRCRIFASSAAPIMKETLEYFLSLDIMIIEAYGMSESTGIIYRRNLLFYASDLHGFNQSYKLEIFVLVCDVVSAPKLEVPLILLSDPVADYI